MFSTIARFELRYQIGNPVFWVAAIMFFLLTFGATTAESIRLGSSGNIHINAPTAVAQVQLIMSLFFMFVTTAFVSNVVVRDDDSGFAGIIRATRVGKLPYMFGRFSGAFLGAALAFLAVPLAIWIGTFMPWINPDLLGPNRLRDYAWGYFVVALPNLLITSAAFFGVACWTRSVTYSYLTAVLFMFVYFALNAMLRKWPDLASAAYFEPFGAIAFDLHTRYLTPIQANTQALELSGSMLGNRLVWLAISVLIVIVAVWRFRFAEPGLGKGISRRQAAREQKLAAIQPMVVARLLDNAPERAGWHQLYTRAMFEMKLVFKSPAFWVLFLVGSLNLFSTLNAAGRFYGVPMWPRTFAIVDVVLGNSMLITLLMAIYFAGEAVWRERERRFSEIVDATPLPNWVFLISKLAGVAGALLVLCVAVVLVQSILFQLARGLTDIEFGQWLAWFAVPTALYIFQISVLAILAQAISPNKFVGWGLMLLYLIASTVFAGMGLDHPLLNYASVGVRLSDMNGANYGGATAWWMRIYWTLVAVILIVVGHLMWRRGTAVTLKDQWRTLPARLRGKPAMVLSSSFVVTLVMTVFLYYNMNILNQRFDADEQERQAAQYEKEYSQYLGLPQPTLTDIKLDVDLQLTRRFAQFDGTYHFVNATTLPIETLHVRLLAPFVSLESMLVPGATLVHDDRKNRHRIYRFEQPLQPGATGTLSFRTVMHKRGLASLPSDRRFHELDAQPAPNGAYLTSLGFAPALGMDRSNFLQGNVLRRKYGLGPELPTPPLEDETALGKSYAGVERVNTDITVTTDADQTLIATGALVSETVASGRRTARFVSPIPTLNFITIQSGRYAVKTAEADGVQLSVYYFPKHPWNVDRMLEVMRDALDYYRRNFGPYQYSYARIIERPDYGGGANSAPGTVGYSEKAGFTMDLRDPQQLDFLAYVTAHELAHQYWFHQVMPGDVQGAEVLTETLSQYSAMMVMKHRYQPEQLRQFLKYELDFYLQGRRKEAAREQPLARVNKQGYIHYNKGSIVMYLIQDRLGEERVNEVLRGLIDRYRFKGAPYARSSDLVDGLLELARTPAERELILDLFYRITLYDLRVKQASVRRLADGQYETTIDIVGGKSYVDEDGNEAQAPLDEQIDVGVFTMRPDDRDFGSEHVLQMQRLSIRAGEQQVRLVTKDKPLYAGVDPYLTFIDRNSNDNVVRVSSAAP
jgi:ABC-2 type transport system permease protein